MRALISLGHVLQVSLWFFQHEKSHASSHWNERHDEQGRKPRHAVKWHMQGWSTLLNLDMPRSCQNEAHQHHSVQLWEQKLHKRTWLHHAKSHRPFELFANENCKLQNEAKMNATFERGSAQDLSAWSSLCWDERCFCVKNRCASCAVFYDFVCNDSSCQTIQNETCSNCVQQSEGHSRCSCADQHLWWWFVILSSDVLRHLWASGLAATGPTRWRVTNEWVPHEDALANWGVAVAQLLIIDVCKHHVLAFMLWWQSDLNKGVLFD